MFAGFNGISNGTTNTTQKYQILIRKFTVQKLLKNKTVNNLFFVVHTSNQSYYLYHNSLAWV